MYFRYLKQYAIVIAPTQIETIKTIETGSMPLFALRDS